MALDMSGCFAIKTGLADANISRESFVDVETICRTSICSKSPRHDVEPRPAVGAVSIHLIMSGRHLAAMISTGSNKFSGKNLVLRNLEITVDQARKVHVDKTRTQTQLFPPLLKLFS